MAKNWNYLETFGVSLPYYVYILTKAENVYYTYGKVNLWSYIKRALLWISLAESWNYPTTFGEPLTHLQFQQNLSTGLQAIWINSIYGVT